MRIFLLCGKAGSGKNEVANIIKKELPKTVITSLSKYIKLFAFEMTDWDGNDNTKPRTFLQEMGDNLRSINEDFLINRLTEDFKVYNQYYDNIVVSDIRLINELEKIKEINDYKVITIRINCTDCKRKLDETEKQHHTETELDNYDNFDYVIENNYNEELVYIIKDILKGMK